MAQPAIRNTDVHACANHGAEKISAVAPLDITVNGEAALHVGHGFTCGGQPTQVATGSTTVRFHGEFAARAFDDSGHGGKLLIGSGNVVIGGPKGMGTVGAGKTMCEKAAEGRQSGNKKQSYGNCVLESVRQILLRAGHNVSEDELVQYAISHQPPLCYDPAIFQRGAANGDMGMQLLSDFGVQAERLPPNDLPPSLATVQQALAEGRGVVAFVDGPLWFPGVQAGNHAIVVTGVELDDDGNVTAVFVNDSGANSDQCGQRVPVDRFRNAMTANARPLLVTKGPLS